jgi:hypothetical protein
VLVFLFEITIELVIKIYKAQNANLEKHILKHISSGACDE